VSLTEKPLAPPTWAESVAIAIGSTRAEGLEISEFGHSVLGALAREEIDADEACARLVAYYRQ
jgi:hypothetical protein